MVKAKQSQERLNQVKALLQTMRGQSIPDALMQAYLFDEKSEQTKTVGAQISATVTPTALPHCIGAFQHTDNDHDMRGMLTAVGWCFSEPGFNRTNENIWAVYLSDASVITTDEIERIVRSNQKIGRELEVPQTVAWLITDASYSREASARIAQLGIHTSTWENVIEIAARVLNPASEESQSATSARQSPTIVASPEPKITIAESEIITETSSEALVEKPAEKAMDKEERQAVVTRQEIDTVHDEEVLELRLPPLEDMEMVAAQNVEQLAQRFGFDSMAVGQIKMATLEACLNAIERTTNSEKEVRVLLRMTADRLIIEVENEGGTFDPQHVGSPDVAQKMQDSYKRGWGLKLIQKFMDRVVFEPYELGTRLRMEKNRPSKADGGENISAVSQA